MKPTEEKKVTLDLAQNLYVIPWDGSTTHHGFENVERDTVQMLAFLHEDRDSAIYPGTLDAYAYYKAVLARFAESPQCHNTWYDPGTHARVIALLDKLRKTMKVIRIYQGDPETGKLWLEENDTIGRVGRSTGIKKVPLLVPEGESGGGAILSRHILRIDVRDDNNRFKELWSAKNLVFPELRIVTERKNKNYPYGVTADGKDQAAFRSYGKAAAYVAWMLGEDFNPSDE